MLLLKVSRIHLVMSIRRLEGRVQSKSGGMVGIWATFGSTGVSQRSSFWLPPGLSLGNFPNAGPSSLGTLGSLGLALGPRIGSSSLTPPPTILILSFSLKELMDCFSATPSFSNKRFP